MSLPRCTWRQDSVVFGRGRWHGCVGIACCLVVEVQLGHAGAQARGDLETAAAKNKDMKESGIHVPESVLFQGFFPTVVGILYSLTEPWIPSMKVKGPQRMPAIFEPHSLKRTKVVYGRWSLRIPLRTAVGDSNWRIMESTLAHPALRELTRMQR